MVLSSVPRQSGGYSRYAQRHVRYVLTCPLSLRQVPFLDKAVVCPLSTKTSRYAQCKLCRRRGFHSAVLGWSLTCLLVCKRQGFGQTVEKTVVPQLQFFAGHRHPDPHGPDHSTDHRDSTVAVCIWWSMSLVCGSRRLSGAVAAVENSVEIPRVFLDKVVDMPCCATTGAWSLGAENCGSPQLQFIDKVWTSL